MKKLIGWLILIVIFIVLFAAVASDVGIIGAIMVWGTAVLFTALIVLGFILITYKYNL